MENLPIAAALIYLTACGDRHFLSLLIMERKTAQKPFLLTMIQIN
jgi:hypothetical protein